MRILIISILLSSLLVSCNDSNADKSKPLKEYDIESYKFSVPSNWINAENISYDSRNLLFINKKDSIIVSNGDTNILDNPIIVSNQKEKEELLNFSNGELLSRDIMIYKNKDFDISHSIYLKNYYYYDIINNINVMLIFPKKEKGTIAAIFNKNSDGKKLSIYCNNPSLETQQSMKKVFETVVMK
jgi:hypothetical protein